MLSLFRNRKTRPNVVARRLRGNGLLSRNGPLVLSVGDAVFNFHPLSFVTMKSVTSDAGGSIVGQREFNGPEVTLATFSRREDVDAAMAAVVAAYAGIKGGKKGFGWMWLLGLPVLFVAILLGASGVDEQPTAAQQHSSAEQQLQQMMAAQAGGAPTKGFNPNEPTLEQIAGGEYKFDPKIEQPKVEMPGLNCAPKS